MSLQSEISTLPTIGRSTQASIPAWAFWQRHLLAKMNPLLK